MTHNPQKNKVPKYYKFTIDYLEKIFHIIYNYEFNNCLDNYEELIYCKTLKNLINGYMTGDIKNLEFIQEIKKEKYFFDYLT